MTSSECLNCSRGVHVGDRHSLFADARCHEVIPAVFNLVNDGHVSHGASSSEIWEDYLLVIGGQDVGTFSHEVHTAEDDVFGVGARCCFTGQLEAVSGDVCEVNDLIALVVVAKHECAVT